MGAIIVYARQTRLNIFSTLYHNITLEKIGAENRANASVDSVSTLYLAGAKMLSG